VDPAQAAAAAAARVAQPPVGPAFLAAGVAGRTGVGSDAGPASAAHAPAAATGPDPTDTGSAPGIDAAHSNVAWNTALSPQRSQLPPGVAPAPQNGPSPANTPPAQQLAVHLAPLKDGPDGVHRLEMRLNPEALGPISVIAEVRDGSLTVHLTGSTDAGREAMKAALPDLERDLRDSGFSSCSLNVASDGPRQDRPAYRPNWPDAAGPNRGPLEQQQVRRPTGAPTAHRDSGGGLDLHV
jgi:flagellar hook-length control protein FliK